LEQPRSRLLLKANAVRWETTESRRLGTRSPARMVDVVLASARSTDRSIKLAPRRPPQLPQNSKTRILPATSPIASERTMLHFADMFLGDRSIISNVAFYAFPIVTREYLYPMYLRAMERIYIHICARENSGCVKIIFLYYFYISRSNIQYPLIP
jgi:hypothetical protein